MATRMGAQENHSPHEPVEVLDGSEIALKDLSYLDVLDMYPYVPIQGTKILGAIPTEDLQRIIALQNALHTHKLPSVQGLNRRALQKYFRFNSEREDQPFIARSEKFVLPPAYKERHDNISNSSPRNPNITGRHVGNRKRRLARTDPLHRNSMDDSDQQSAYVGPSATEKRPGLEALPTSGICIPASYYSYDDGDISTNAIPSYAGNTWVSQPPPTQQTTSETYAATSDVSRHRRASGRTRSTENESHKRLYSGQQGGYNERHHQGDLEEDTPYNGKRRRTDF